MFISRGRPLTGPYTSISQSKRWNRQPIPTGSSDCDDRSGGGVSLTAVSDFDDGTPVSSSPPTFGDKKNPVTRSSNLRGDAKPFSLPVQPEAEISPGSTIVGTTQTPLVDSAPQPATAQVAQLATNGGRKGASSVLTDTYLNGQGQKHTNGDTHDYDEYGVSTTYSSPIKEVRAGNILVTPIKKQQNSHDRLTSSITTAVKTTQLTPSGPGQDVNSGPIGEKAAQVINISPNRQQGEGRRFSALSARSSYNQQVSPAPLAFTIDRQHPQVQKFSNGMHNIPFSTKQVLNYQQSQIQGHTVGEESVSPDGRLHRKPAIQNGPTAVVHGYNYGLPGSVSDGSMSQYFNQLPSTSKNLGRFHHNSINDQPTVGPMEFGTPTKETMANRSEMLQALTENGGPHRHDLLSSQFLPFTECYKFSYPPEENGVIAVRNIPYETTRGEIVALLGKSSKILNDRQEPVHIIMDRVTSKTQDAYCELSSLDAAIELVERFKRGTETGRIGRLGSRIVEVELSSQTHLMATLFPSSKNGVNWIGTKPQIIMGSENPWENFKGFFTEEEMIMLSKHVENPQRSLYARICPERPYECMISTLRKTPWYMAEYITIKQRHSVYEACMKMIGTFVNKLQRRDFNGAEAERLTPQLLNRLVTSAMLCPGFSVVQKHNIATIAGLSEAESREFNQPRFADSWRLQWTIAPKAGMPIDVLEWYIAVIRTETVRVVQSLDISQRMPLQEMMEGHDGYWGFFWAEVNFPIGRVWDNMSLAECARMEWQAIDRIITRATQGGNIPSSYTFGSYHLNPGTTGGPPRLTYKGY